MKAEVIQQRSLLELTELDAELSRIKHRSANLAEQQRYDQLAAELQAANDRLAVLGAQGGQSARIQAEQAAGGRLQAEPAGDPGGAAGRVAGTCRPGGRGPPAAGATPEGDHLGRS